MSKFKNTNRFKNKSKEWMQAHYEHMANGHFEKATEYEEAGDLENAKIQRATARRLLILRNRL